MNGHPIKGAPALLLTMSLLGLSACGSWQADDARSSEPDQAEPLFPNRPAAGDDQEPIAEALAEAASRQTAKPTEQRHGEDWPKFLGPRGTGVSGETGLMQKWPKKGPPVLWAKGPEKIGAGYSAPSVRGNRLVLHHRRKDKEIVACMRADNGKQLWQHSYPSNFRDPFGYNNGPRSTPLLRENRCYTFGAEGKLLCLDLQSGKKIWQRDTHADFDVPQGFFGVGATPILEDGLLIVLVGGQPNSGVVAFDAETGKTVWQNVGKATWDGARTGWENDPRYEWTGEEMIVSYSSPIAATIHGKRHVLCLLRHGLVSLAPKTGDVRFKYWFRSRKNRSVNAARPVVVGDKIFLTATYRVGSALLRVHEDGTSYTEVWRKRNNMQAHFSTPIHVDGYLYGFSGRHESESTFRCLDLETGSVQWQTKGFDGDISQFTRDPRTGRIQNKKTGQPVPFPYFGRGSIIRTGQRFILLGERGTLALVKVDPIEFQEISRTSYPKIHYPSWTAPVLSRKRLYLRCEDGLVCLDLKQPAEEND